MSGIILQARAYLERERLQPDLNRAGRCVVAFMVPILAASLWHLPIEASFAAIAAQNIAIVDVRGSYPLRLSLLLTMAAVLAGATWLGSASTSHLFLVLGSVVFVTLAGGVWRHLSADYGASLATASALLFLIALVQPDGAALRHEHFLSALAGGVWGVLVQVALWPFRAQHPRRRVVADSWLAVSDLVEAMVPQDGSNHQIRHRRLAERQAEVRTALDHATALLTAAETARHPRPYLRQLEELNLAAARVATRMVAFNTAFETMMERADFAALAPSFAPIFTSLVNTTRTVALTVVSRQPSHLAACEVRLLRLGHLLQALQDRVLTQTHQSADSAQLGFILRQIADLLPATQQALRATIDRADEHTAFSVELFDLQTWTLRPLASTLNLQWRSDRTLIRFIARSMVLQLIGVFVFKFFGLARGYWFPLTMLVVLQPDYGATRMRAGQRVVGTLVGGILASVLLWLPLPPAMLLGAMAITIAGFAFWLKRNYTVAVFFITLFVVLVTETSTKITIAFTLERLAATAAGGILALLAAHLFWPVWERQRLPALLAQGLRASREFVRVLGDRLADGGSFDAEAIAAKRAVEVSNSIVFTSLQRMSGDPQNQQASIETAAALANGNQRLTRALTVVAVHLSPGVKIDRPEFTAFVTVAMETLDALAVATESGRIDPSRLQALRSALDRITLTAPTTPEATLKEQSAAHQFARCATELSAMLLAFSTREISRTGFSGPTETLPRT